MGSSLRSATLRGGQALRWLALLVVLASGLARPLVLDRWPWGLALSYPPRLLLTGLALALLTEALWRGGADGRRRAQLAGALALTLPLQLAWGGGPRPVPDGALTVLSYNVHHAAHGAPELARLAAEHDAALLVLQEVGPEERAAFVEALDDYACFWADETARFEHDDYGPFSSLTAVRRDLLGDQRPAVETAITGYRSFALRLELDGGPLWVVNVHTTKAFWSLTRHPGLAWSHAAEKALWHLGERRRLARWLDRHAGEAVLLAGDFNAPWGSRGLDLPGTRHAHRQVGAGWHVTAPASLPLWGIDHVLGAGPLAFHEYTTFDAGLSDHCAQLARFSVGAPPAEATPGATRDAPP